MNHCTKTVTVITANRYLGQKIALELAEIATVRIETERSPFLGTDMVFYDVNSLPLSGIRRGDILLTKNEKAIPTDHICLSVPFSMGAAKEIVKGARSPLPLQLSKEDKSALLFGERISLSDLEFAILQELIRANGHFVSKEKLTAAAWGDTPIQGNVLTVYIHYLRKKLEKEGTKVILSSRTEGYGIRPELLSKEEM